MQQLHPVILKEFGRNMHQFPAQNSPFKLNTIDHTEKRGIPVAWIWAGGDEEGRDWSGSGGRDWMRPEIRARRSDPLSIIRRRRASLPTWLAPPVVAAVAIDSGDLIELS